MEERRTSLEASPLSLGGAEENVLKGLLAETSKTLSEGEAIVEQVNIKF